MDYRKLPWISNIFPWQTRRDEIVSVLTLGNYSEKRLTYAVAEGPRPAHAGLLSGRAGVVSI